MSNHLSAAIECRLSLPSLRDAPGPVNAVRLKGAAKINTGPASLVIPWQRTVNTSVSRLSGPQDVTFAANLRPTVRAHPHAVHSPPASTETSGGLPVLHRTSVQPELHRVRVRFLESGSPHHNTTGCVPDTRRCLRAAPLVVLFKLPVLLLLLTAAASAGQAPAQIPEPPPPEAPQPLLPAKLKIPVASPCQIKRDAVAMAQAGAAGAMASNPDKPLLSPTLLPGSCPPLAPLIDWYARFLNGPQVKRLTPKQKAWLATRDLIDPFNGITILANSAIFVGANSHSAYGPGMSGFAQNVGVSYAQDMTGEFLGTFLIPSIVHQDPHYHRLPAATLKRRIAHAIYQVVWTQGDDGKGMVNYANLVGFAIDDEISNLYVPGQQTNLPSSASRYAIDIATAPIDNFITEFLPDVAKRIHVRVVLVQRIINQVATTESSSQ